MNDDRYNIPPPIPPTYAGAGAGAGAGTYGGTIPVAESPDDRAPIAGIFGAAEAVLRQPRRLTYQLRQPQPGGLIGALLLITFVCSLVYGIVVGTFSGGDQLWIAPVKIAGGLLFSALICLPSLYIFSCLSGSQARLVEVGGLLMGLLALLTILLVGFAPVALVFSTSTGNLAAMGTLHLMFGLIATGFGLRFLHAGFAQLQSRPLGSRFWGLIFMLVLLQMTTALRPIIGTSSTFFTAEKKFFVSHWVDCMKPEPWKPERAR